jgi:hypothetical protein
VSTFTYYDHDETVGRMRMADVGRWVDPGNPDPETIELEDIARALSKLCRFGGHISGEGIYSVGEHSLHVAAQLWRQFGSHEVALCGLMHDATEAYLSDVIRPVKSLLVQYRAMEAKMAKAIAERFNLPELDELARLRGHVGPEAPTVWGLVKRADEEILPWEMAMVRDCPWRVPTPTSVVERAFTDAFHRHYRGWVAARRPAPMVIEPGDPLYRKAMEMIHEGKIPDGAFADLVQTQQRESDRS